MKIWLASLAIIFFSACSSTDPCSKVSGSCLDIEITDGPALNQLQITLTGVVSYTGTTPANAGTLRTPPIITAVELPIASGSLNVAVQGLDDGVVVGSAQRTITIAVGQHQTVKLSFAGSLDLGVADAGSGDLGNIDLGSTDLKSSDMHPSDLGAVDLGHDMSGPSPRHVFLLTARGMPLGTITALDLACTAAAHTAAWSSTGSGQSNARAIISYPAGEDAATHIDLSEGRPIVLPSGAAVATDSTFFSATHLGPIDEVAGGTTLPSGCVWTGSGAAGNLIAAMGTCVGWTSALVTDSGYTGTSSHTDATWAFDNVTTCDQTCYVYCMEQ